MLDTQNTVKKGFAITTEHCLHIVRVATDLSAEQLDLAFQKLNDRLSVLNKGMQVVTEIIKTKNNDPITPQ